MIIRRMYYNLILLKNLSDNEFQKMLSEVVEFTTNICPISKAEVSKSLLFEVITFKKTISK
jgi:hypothetical protein